MKIEEKVRKEVLDLSPYEVDSSISRTLNERVVKLNLNENFAVASDVINRLLLEVSQSVDVRLYPPPYGDLAVQAISRFYGFSQSEICVGNGADHLLDSLMKIFVKKGSKVLVAEPTFPLYTYFTQLYGGEKVAVTLETNFGLNADATLQKVDKETSMVILCSPNNPTGNQFNKEDLQKILQEFDGVVVIDETYADFASYTLIDWVRRFGNLVVLKSYSKAFGSAGIRLGYLVSNRSIVEYFRRVTSPFDVNIVAQRFVAVALQNWNYFKERIDYVVKEREWLTKALARIEGIAPYPSQTNFVLFKIDNNTLSSLTVKKRLERRNVLVKDRSNLPLLENCLRVTVGTRYMNEVFVSTLKETLEE